jgi:hypothetical protein
VKGYLDERAILAGGPLEGPGLLGPRHTVHPDIPVLARCQNMLPTPETMESFAPHIFASRNPWGAKEMSYPPF